MSGTNREVAHRVFAAEYDEATHSYSESDEERAPNYVVTPTGARVNRLFFVGVLTEVEQVSDDVLRARIADPTGAFVVYAGQYQPDEMAFLEDAEPPLFVAVTGKARTFSPDDSDRVFTSVRPESINEVDAEARDRWTVSAAEQTLARVATARAAMDLDATGDELAEVLLANGVAPSMAHGIPRAFDVYGTTEAYLAAVSDLAVDALALVAGETDEVTPPSVAPDDPGTGTVDAASLADAVGGAVVDLDPTAGADEATAHEDGVGEGDAQQATAAATAAAGGSTESGEEAAGADETTPEAEPTSDADEMSEPDGAPAAADAGTDGRAESPGAGEPATAAADTTEGASEEADAADPTGAAVEDADTADASTGDGEDLGDFEPGGVDDDEPGATAGDESAPADTEDVLDDEERERLEEEYGTFSTGTEVDEPGEAGIEPEAGPIEPEEMPDEPATDEAAETGAADATEADDVDEAAGRSEPADEPAGESDETATDEPADDESAAVDLEAAAIEAMETLDDGDGAVREEVIATLVDDHGVDPDAAEEAIQDALMAGKCYEPADDRVKPI